MIHFFNINQKIIKLTNLLVLIICCNACQNLAHKKNISLKKLDKSPVEIALLLPLSGTHKQQGQEYIDFIEAGIGATSNPNIHISIYNGATKESILTALPKIIANNTKIILGPLSNGLTEFVASKLKKTDIITISLGNKIPNNNNKKLLLFGHQPSEQLLSVTQGCLNSDYQYFITLLPNNIHFKEINNQIRSLIVKNGAMLVKTEFYNNNPESIENKIKIIANSIENLATGNKLNQRIVIITFVSDSMSNVLKDGLTEYNLSNKVILAGNNKLDTYHLMVHSVFASSKNILNNSVHLNYDNNLNNISNKQAIAFDLGSLVIKNLTIPFNRHNFLNKLCSSRTFDGITGKINFIDGVATRKYDIIHRVGNEYKLLTNNYY